MRVLHSVYTTILAAAGMHAALALLTHVSLIMLSRGRPAGGGLRVLVAEDNALLQDLFRSMLVRLGHLPELVGDGYAALAALERQHFDVALLDIQIPGIDGLEVARCVCASRPPAQRPYLVAITATPGQRAACLAAGMQQYVTKPVQLAELAWAIESCREPDAERPAAPLLAPDTVTPPGPLDRQLFARVREVLGQQFQRVVASYIADTDGLIARMRAAVAGADPRALTHASHKLASSSAFLGAVRLASLCGEAEYLSHSHDLEAWRDVVQRIEAEFAGVKDALEQVA